MPPRSQIDAVLVPAEYCTAQDNYWRLAQLASEFAPLLGVRVLLTRELLDGRTLIPRSFDDTLRFPHGHPREGEPRYTWTARPQNDGVLYGHLIDAD